MPSEDGYEEFMNADGDVELELVEPRTTRFRFYGLSECRTLFGELCLRIVWGRLGNRRMRERSEVFRDRAALERRRTELVGLRRRHGYVSSSTPRVVAQARAAAPSPAAAARLDARTLFVARAILEQH